MASSSCFHPDHSAYTASAPPTTDVDDDETYGTSRTGDPNDFLAQIGNYCNNPELSDLILKVGEQRYHAHKLILVSSSDVFRTMLTGSTWAESTTQEIELEEDYICEPVFPDFLKFLYTNCIYISDDIVIPLRTLADKYMVQRLSKLCIDYMCNELNCDNVIGWDKYATKFTLTRLSEECFTFMQQNIDLLIDSKKFLNMNIDQFVKVLQSSYVHIPDEYTLFKSVKDWAFAYDRSCSSDDIKSNLGIMLPHIRYPMMTGEQLDTIEKDEAINACYPEMKDEINSSYKFHATAITNPNWSLRKVTPRHYYHGYSCKFTLPNYSRRHHDNNRYVKVFPAYSSNGPSRTLTWDWFVSVAMGGRTDRLGVSNREPILEVSNPGPEQEERSVRLMAVFYGKRNGSMFKKVHHTTAFTVTDYNFHHIKMFGTSLPSQFIVKDTVTFHAVITPTEKIYIKCS
ncbi:BTB/POZ domain-containing protein 17-like [Ptychodera flava]|uniref:BTB/POZ domain-containing protein 17-like n=1 Tax=Ptychodera flava TaxID=63121 RepID=UPI00396A1775